MLLPEIRSLSTIWLYHTLKPELKEIGYLSTSLCRGRYISESSRQKNSYILEINTGFSPSPH